MNQEPKENSMFLLTTPLPHTFQSRYCATKVHQGTINTGKLCCHSITKKIPSVCAHSWLKVQDQSLKKVELQQCFQRQGKIK
jgi:hypothetical protein